MKGAVLLLLVSIESWTASLYRQPIRYSQRLTDTGDSEVGTVLLEVRQATMTCKRRHVALFSPVNVSATCEALNVSFIASASLLLLPSGSQPAPSNEPALAAGERRSEMNKCNWPKLPNEIPEGNRSGRYLVLSLENMRWGFKAMLMELDVIASAFSGQTKYPRFYPQPASRVCPRAGDTRS